MVHIFLDEAEKAPDITMTNVKAILSVRIFSPIPFQGASSHVIPGHILK